MYEGPEFRHLRYFVAVAEECNFGKAARRLHVSQPSLSTQIKQLEDGLGAKLLLRGPTGTSLTAAGAAFLGYAQQMLQMRERAMQNTSSVHLGKGIPLHFGYSPFVDHALVREALKGFRELVPHGHIEPSSECSGPLALMVDDGHLDAALVTMPIVKRNLFVHPICTEPVLVCLRADDPHNKEESLSKSAIEKNLRVFFGRVHHPLLFDQFKQRFAKAGIRLQPSHLVSTPAEMQFLVKTESCFGIVRQSTPLDPELTTRKIAGLSLRVVTAFICNGAQQRPVLPLLAYRLAKMCADGNEIGSRKRPVASVPADTPGQIRMFG
jgi:DNA-binding transcriptional LysR family regulator